MNSAKTPVKATVTTRLLTADEFQRLIPTARVEMVANAAHMAPLEQPATVARLIREFLK